MSEFAETSARPTDPVGRVLYQIAKWLAVCGGVILFAMAVLTTISVTGRAALSAPIAGDFELVAIGTGLAIFAFLPWCQLERGNVLVDFFMAKTPVRTRVEGIAFAGERGIERVEVSTDDGVTWSDAELHDPFAPLAWRFWSFELDATVGTHELRVRATDGKGGLQISEKRSALPDGSSGYHKRTLRAAPSA